MDEGFEFFVAARTRFNRSHTSSPDIALGCRDHHSFHCRVSCAFNSYRAFVVWRSKSIIILLLTRPHLRKTVVLIEFAWTKIPERENALCVFIGVMCM